MNGLSSIFHKHATPEEIMCMSAVDVAMIYTANNRL